MARMAAGDELKLSLNSAGERLYGKAWEGLGQVLRISDCEVSLMMHGGNVPLEITDGYQVRCVSISLCLPVFYVFYLFIAAYSSYQ